MLEGLVVNQLISHNTCLCDFTPLERVACGYVNDVSPTSTPGALPEVKGDQTVIVKDEDD